MLVSRCVPSGFFWGFLRVPRETNLSAGHIYTLHIHIYIYIDRGIRAVREGLILKMTIMFSQQALEWPPK